MWWSDEGVVREALTVGRALTAYAELEATESSDIPKAERGLWLGYSNE